MPYGLLDTGFARKSFDEIKADIIAELQNSLGDIRSDAGSVFGNMISVISTHLEDVWELAEDVWNSRSLAASGVSLDDIVAWVGMTRIPAMPSVVTITLAGDETTVVPIGTIVRDEDTGKQFMLQEETTIPAEEEIDADFYCLEYGPISALAGKVTQIVTPVSGLDSVTNAADATLGRDQETDAELRARFQSGRSSLGYARYDAIRNRILQEVDNVVSCSVFENTTDATDGDGRPPHSFEVVVDCPTSAEQSVADKIWECKPVGIATFGNANSGNGYSVTDSEGYTHTIKFSKVTYKYVHVNIVLTYSSEVTFPVNGIDTIKTAIKTYGDTLTVGNDLIIQALFSSIYSVPGLTAAAVEWAITDDPGGTPSYDDENIPLSGSELAKFSTDRITIV